MADVNDLNLNDDPIEVPDVMPEERGSRIPMLQPCTGQIFQLPEKFDYSTIATDQGQRLSLNLRKEFAAKTYPGGLAVNTSINNMERDSKDKDGKTVKVNALAFLLRNGFKFTGPLKTNKDFVAALEPHKGDYFQADWEWSANCNPKKDIYKGGQQIKGRSGCGQRYGMRQRSYTDRNGKATTVLAIPRNSDGSFVEQFDCMGKRADGSPCDANLFANGEHRNFKPVERGEG